VRPRRTLTIIGACYGLAFLFMTARAAPAQAPAQTEGPRTVAIVGRVQIDLGAHPRTDQNWMATVLTPVAQFDRGQWKPVPNVSDDPARMEALQGSVFYGVRHGTPWSCLGGQSRSYWGSLGYKLWGLSSEIFDRENDTRGDDRNGQPLVVTHPLTRRPEGAAKPRWRKSWIASHVQDAIVKAANATADAKSAGPPLAVRGPLETYRERAFWLRQDRPAVWVEYAQRLRAADNREGAGYYQAVFDPSTASSPEALWESLATVPDIEAPGPTAYYQFIDYCDLTGDGVSEIVLSKTHANAQQFQLYDFNGKTFALVASTDEER